MWSAANPASRNRDECWRERERERKMGRIKEREI